MEFVCGPILADRHFCMTQIPSRISKSDKLYTILQESFYFLMKAMFEDVWQSSKWVVTGGIAEEFCPLTLLLILICN